MSFDATFLFLFIAFCIYSSSSNSGIEEENNHKFLFFFFLTNRYQLS